MTMSRHAITDAPLFSHCNDKQRTRLESISTPVDVKAGYQLTREGTIGREFGVLLEGTATVTVDGAAVATLRAGDHYGEVALLDQLGITHLHSEGRRNATVTADTDLWVAVMSVQEFSALLVEFPDIADSIRKAANDRAVAR